MEPFNGIAYHSSTGERAHLVLEEVSVDVLICDVSARIFLHQTYTNTSDGPTGRAKYVFPVPSRAAVCAFDLQYADGRTISGVAKEKTKAVEEHEKAIREGKSTGLLEWVTDDIFTMSVGSIPANQRVKTRVVYVIDLMDEALTDQVRFQLPVALGQRYGSQPSGIDGAGAASSRTRLRITAHIQMSGRIRDVSSPTHSIGPLIPYKTHVGRLSHRRTTAKFRLPSFLERDFVLIIKADGLDSPRCFAERDRRRGTDTIALQLTVVPTFNLPLIPAQEFIFIVDRSGSMSGSRIETAKRTLNMLLRMLPSALTIFNVFSFGSHADSLWPISQKYTQSCLEHSTRHVESMDADYGGTEICSALQLALGSRNSQIPTVVFVLTDGEAHDIDMTLNTVSKAVALSNATAPLRVFTLGIGETVSTAMCEGIARVGNGLCLLAAASENIVGKCARLLRAGRSSILEDVSINWGFPSEIVLNSQAQSLKIQQTPHRIHNIDPGMRFVVFAICSHKTLPTHVTIRGRLKHIADPILLSVPVTYAKPFAGDEVNVPFIHTLASHYLITDIDEGRAPLPGASSDVSLADIQKTAIVRLGEKYQLASRHTSFVALETTEKTLARSMHDPHGRSLRSRNRVSNEGTERTQKSHSLAENVIETTLATLSFIFGALGNYFQGGRSRGRSAQRIPGAFSDSPSPARSARNDEDDQRVGSFSTLSSLDGSRSAWSSSRTPSPSPAPSLEAEQPRSSSPPFQSLSNAPVSVQKQYGYGERKTGPSSNSSPSDPVPPQIFDLVRLQSFDGSFLLDQSLGDIVGHSALGKAAEFQAGDKTWATALAVAFLKKHLSKQPDLLEGLIDKAMEFVKGDANFNSLVASAGAFVK